MFPQRDIGSRSVALLTLGLAAVLAGCGGAAPGVAATPVPSPSTLSAPPSAAVASASASAEPACRPAASASGSGPSGWTRPLEVKPIGEASIFKVVSQTPSPGDKVPIFFMGAQF